MAEISAMAPAERAPLSAWARKLALALSGEGMQSAFHFAVNLFLLKSLPAAEYGLFALVFTLGSFALTYAHAGAAVPATVFLPRFRSPGAVRFGDVVFGSVAAAYAAAAGAAAALGLMAWAGSPGLALAAGAFVALWSVRTYCRAALYARRLPGLAARSDLGFAASGAAFLVAVQPLAGTPSGRLALAFGVLAAANGVGVAVAFLGQPRRPRVSLRSGIRRRYAAVWPSVAWSLVGITTLNVQAQAHTFLVALLAGPAAFAPVAAAFVLLAPLRLAASSLVLLAQPEFASALAHGRAERVRAVLLGGTGLVLALCGGYGAALLLFWPTIRNAVFGPGFADAPVGLATAAAWAIGSLYVLYVLPKAALEAAGRFQAVAQATLVGAGVAVAGVAGLLAAAGVMPSLAGLGAAEAVVLLLVWRSALRLGGGRGSSAVGPARVP